MQTKDKPFKWQLVLLSLLGMVVLAIGLNILLLLDIGLSSFDTMTYYIQHLLNMDSFGNAALIIHGIVCIPLIFLVHKNEESYVNIVVSIFSIFILTRIINIFAFITGYDISQLSVLIGIILFIIGFTIFTTGVLMISKANLIIPPYDKFVVETVNFFGMKLGTTRLVFDIILLMLVFVLSIITNVDIPFSLGTLLITFGTGSYMNLIEKIFLNRK